MISLCKETDWKASRALLFLDPCATELKWDTLSIVAATKAIDVWYLFPFSATQRLLRKDGQLDESWKKKLNTLLGAEDWYESFYKEDPQLNLFDDENMIKSVNTKNLAKYIVSRLSTIFPTVADNPRFLYTNKSPLFLFCFAVSNENKKAAKIALRIANHILGSK